MQRYRITLSFGRCPFPAKLPTCIVFVLFSLCWSSCILSFRDWFSLRCFLKLFCCFSVSVLDMCCVYVELGFLVFSIFFKVSVCCTCLFACFPSLLPNIFWLCSCSLVCLEVVSACCFWPCLSLSLPIDMVVSLLPFSSCVHGFTLAPVSPSLTTFLILASGGTSMCVCVCACVVVLALVLLSSFPFEREKTGKFIRARWFRSGTRTFAWSHASGWIAGRGADSTSCTLSLLVPQATWSMAPTAAAWGPVALTICWPHVRKWCVCVYLCFGGVLPRVWFDLLLRLLLRLLF